MKEAWKGILVIAVTAIVVPWYLAGFKVDALGFWLRLVAALVLGALAAAPLVDLIQRRFGKLLAVLVAFMVIPEVVLFFHFILIPRVTEFLIR